MGALIEKSNLIQTLKMLVPYLHLYHVSPQSPRQCMAAWFAIYFVPNLISQLPFIFMQN
jgi:hypothetical protein